MPIPASGGATKKADALFADHPQQPADVVARGTQHGMHRIARLPLEMTAIHAVIARVRRAPCTRSANTP